MCQLSLRHSTYECSAVVVVILTCAGGSDDQVVTLQPGAMLPLSPGPELTGSDHSPSPQYLPPANPNSTMKILSPCLLANSLAATSCAICRCPGMHCRRSETGATDGAPPALSSHAPWPKRKQQSDREGRETGVALTRRQGNEAVARRRSLN